MFDFTFVYHKQNFSVSDERPYHKSDLGKLKNLGFKSSLSLKRFKGKREQEEIDKALINQSNRWVKRLSFENQGWTLGNKDLLQVIRFISFVTNTVNLKGIRISHKQFQMIMRNSWGAYTLKFEKCHIQRVNAKLPSKIKFRTKKIYFKNWLVRNNKRGKSQNFLDILETISGCNLKDSLKVLYLSRFSRTKEETEELLNNYDLSHLWVSSC